MRCTCAKDSVSLASANVLPLKEVAINKNVAESIIGKHEKLRDTIVPTSVLVEGYRTRSDLMHTVKYNTDLLFL